MFSSQLIEAAYEGQLETVRNLLDSKTNVNELDEYGDTALIQATRTCLKQPPLLG